LLSPAFWGSVSRRGTGRGNILLRGAELCNQYEVRLSHFETKWSAPFITPFSFLVSPLRGAGFGGGKNATVKYRISFTGAGETEIHNIMLRVRLRDLRGRTKTRASRKCTAKYRMVARQPDVRRRGPHGNQPLPNRGRPVDFQLKAARRLL